MVNTTSGQNEDRCWACYLLFRTPRIFCWNQFSVLDEVNKNSSPIDIVFEEISPNSSSDTLSIWTNQNASSGLSIFTLKIKQ